MLSEASSWKYVMMQKENDSSKKSDTYGIGPHFHEKHTNRQENQNDPNSTGKTNKKNQIQRAQEDVSIEWKGGSILLVNKTIRKNDPHNTQSLRSTRSPSSNEKGSGKGKGGYHSNDTPSKARKQYQIKRPTAPIPHLTIAQNRKTTHMKILHT